MMSAMTPELEHRLEASPALPTLPPAAMKVLNVARSGEARPQELLEVFKLDPALSTRLLRAANSPSYRRAKEVRTLREALLVLGYDATLALGLSFSLFGAMKDVKGGRLDHAEYWRHCASLASVASILGKHRRIDPSEAILAGLLKDIGVLVLDSVLPPETPEEERRDDMLQQNEVGAWLVRHWGLPQYLSDVCYAADSLETHLGDVLPENQELVEVIGVASDLVEAWFKEDPTETLVDLKSEVARRWSWTPEHLNDVIQEAGSEIQSLLKTMELQQFDETLIIGVMEQARELMLFQSMRSLQIATEATAKAEALSARAKSAEEASLRDPLTGVWNRAHLQRRLDSMVADAREKGTTLTVAFIDLDRFKRVNDTYGHSAGDAVLKEFATRVKETIRNEDLLARYGGEEFTLVMPDTARSAARAALRRVLDKICSRPFKISAEQDIPATASIGFACLDPYCQRYPDAHSLLNEADEAAYEAKRLGRASLIECTESGAYRMIKQFKTGSFLGRLTRRLFR